MIAPEPRLIASVSATLIVLGLSACGDSGQSGFTVGGAPPPNPADWSWMRPSSEMTDEAEALIVSHHGDGYGSPECVPTKSLEGTGEFNFECTAEDRRRGERVEIDVVVHGSDSGDPEVTVLQNVWTSDFQAKGLPAPVE